MIARVKPQTTPARKPAREEDFTTRELEILHLLSYGDGAAEVATKLSISRNGIYYHIKNLRWKLQAHSTHQVVAHAFMDGIVS